MARRLLGGGGRAQRTPLHLRDLFSTARLNSAPPRLRASKLPGMIHLRSFRIRNPDALPDGFPFDLPIVRTLDEVELTAPVAFLVGENGSGKSTLLEAIAASANLPTIGSVAIERDETLTAAQALGRQLVLSWASRSHRGFYMRSEDFFGFGLSTPARSPSSARLPRP